MGCVEPVIPGKDAGYLFYNTANVASAMHDMLAGSASQADGETIPQWGIEALETSDPRQFTSFEEVQEAFQKVVAWQRRNSQSMGARNEMIVMQTPTVYESALIDDCIENGICREEGGAHYNFTATGGLLGSSDAGDSLAAIKKLVFDEKKITMAELCDALDSNFEGYEDIRKLCLEVPKFGNDDDYVDEQVAWVMHQWVSEFKKLKNLRGGYCIPGGSPMAMHVPFGKSVGALPSGRLAGEPLCDASSPSAGNDLSGLTAVLKSSGKIDHTEIHGGAVLNMRIEPAAFEDGNMKRMVDLVRTFVDQKVFHVQINVVSSDALRAAQKEPEKYRDLVVKVAGYNAFFTHLNDELQESVIVRTEHKL
jgi:formate C-acetyltransferase